jgi:predicted transcriptional regulator
VKLKKESKILNFRVQSKSYWVREDQNLKIISKKKERILKLIKKPLLTSEIAKNLNISWKATSRRLKELEKLNLVNQNKKGYWSRKQCKKKIVVI